MTYTMNRQTNDSPSWLCPGRMKALVMMLLMLMMAGNVNF